MSAYVCYVYMYVYVYVYVYVHACFGSSTPEANGPVSCSRMPYFTLLALRSH